MFGSARSEGKEGLYSNYNINGGKMNWGRSMDEQTQVTEIKEALVVFLRVFEEYAKEIFSDTSRHDRLMEIASHIHVIGTVLGFVL